MQADTVQYITFLQGLLACYMEQYYAEVAKSTANNLLFWHIPELVILRYEA